MVLPFAVSTTLAWLMGCTIREPPESAMVSGAIRCAVALYIASADNKTSIPAFMLIGFYWPGTGRLFLEETDLIIVCPRTSWALSLTFSSEFAYASFNSFLIYVFGKSALLITTRYRYWLPLPRRRFSGSEISLPQKKPK